MRIHLLLFLFSVVWSAAVYAQSTFELTGPESTCAGAPITLTATNCTGRLLWNTGATGTTITVVPTVTTTYHATCMTNEVKTVSSISPIVQPVITVSSNTGQCFTLGNTTLTASGAPNGSSLVWRKDGNIIDGVSGTTYTPTQVGSYTAELPHQGEWVFQSPLPHGHNFNDIHMADANVGVAVGDLGIIERTTDGGITWNPASSPTTNNLLSVHFINASVGWIAGEYILLRTTDGGLSWNSVNNVGISYGGYYDEITFIDANNGWIVANSPFGTLLRTTNGGATWTIQNTGMYHQRDIHFVSSLEGWVVGFGTAKKTTDGGRTWKTMTLGEAGKLNDVFFVSSTHGWIISDDKVYRTTDGGNTWDSSSNGGSSVFFTSTMEGWLTSGNAIYKTINGGITWEISKQNSSPLQAIYASSTTNVVATGIAGTILQSTNSGTSWVNTFSQTVTSAISSIKAINATQVYLGARNGTVYKTTNGGKTWLALNSGTSNYLRSIDFVDANTGWAVGDSGTIRKTINGGTTWTSQNVGSGWNFKKVQFLDAATGWISSYGTNIFRTVDGGSTWNILNVGYSINDFHFIDANTGWVVSNNGVQLKTTDGGQNWATVPSGTSNYLSLVYFKDSNNGWVGGDILMKHTTNGGNTWVSQNSNGDGVASLSMSFPNVNEGWVTTSAKNRVLKTTDGGNTWVWQPIGLYDTFAQISFADTQSGWGLSHNGVIMKYTKVTTLCVSNAVILNMLSPAAPFITSNNSQNVLCSGNSITLTATGCNGTLHWNTGATTSSITVSPASTTSYNAYCTDSNGCNAQTFMGVGVIPKVRIDSTLTGTCQIVMLKAENVPSSTTILWKKNGIPVSSVNGRTYTDANAGSYTAEPVVAGAWVSQTGEITPTDLNSVVFPTFSLGIAVGNDGVILKSTDGGATWQTRPSGTKEHLSSIKMVSSSIGWAVGYSGTIVKTMDGGESWITQNLNSGGSINAASFADEYRGWAIVGGRNIYTTADGGNTWIMKLSILGNVLYDVKAISATTAWVTASQGLLLKTTDSGNTWMPRHLNITSALKGITFIDAFNGWIVGDNSTILKTVDGGNTWVHQIASTVNNLDKIQFIDSTTGWIRGDSKIYKTTDGGVTWREASDNSPFGLRNFFMKNANEGLLVGANGAIAQTSDGAITWKSVGEIPQRFYRDIHFINDTIGFAVGNGVLAKTINGGKKWTSQVLDNNYYDLFFVNDTHGWMVGDKNPGFVNGILATTDGGQTWVQQPVGDINSFIHFNSVYFLNTYIGWIVSDFGGIYKTNNGGLTWIKQNSPTPQNLKSVYFIDTNQGWAVGEGGVIITTNNGGEAWKHQISNANGKFTSVQFTSKSNGWAIASEQEGVYKTINGGTTWVKQNIDPNTYSYIAANLYSYNYNPRVQFLDQNNGWILGVDNAFSTTDGGITWKKSYHFNTNTGMYFTNPSTGWIVGNNRIMKFESANTCASEPVIVTSAGVGVLQTVRSGNWNESSVWSCGQVPTITQNVIIKSPHVINVPVTQQAKCKDILIEQGAVFKVPMGASFEASSWR